MIRTALKLLRGQARKPAAPSPLPRWPVGGGECGTLIREKDWSRTPLGPMAHWPAALRTTVANIVNSPVAQVLLWGPDHVALYNDSYMPIVGGLHPTTLGIPGGQVFPELWDSGLPFLELAHTGEVVSRLNLSVVLHRLDGPKTMVVDVFYTPVCEEDGRVGGVICTIIDNSMRVAAERRLKASEAELRRITDAVPTPIAYLDRDFVYRFANHSYEDWLGVPPDRMIGSTVAEVLGEALFEERRPFLERAFGGEAFSVEGAFLHRDGKRRRCELRYIDRKSVV